MSIAATGIDEAVAATAPAKVVRPKAHGGILIRTVFVAYIAILVVIPIAALVWEGLSGGPSVIWAAISAPVAVKALMLSLWTAAIAGVLNGIFGTMIAWVLVRFQFPGKRLISALVDLPFAIPTLVAGILLVALYGPHTWVGKTLGAAGVSVAYAQPGIVLALLFVTLPFVVRAVEPVLLELDAAEEEAAMMLGASPLRTLVSIVLPPLVPAIAAGSLQVFSRSIAEFGSIAAVSGNIPFRTLTAPVQILGDVEGGDPTSAAALSLVLLVVALVLQPLAIALSRATGARRE
jgi:sulfate transport system permease protein